MYNDKIGMINTLMKLKVVLLRFAVGDEIFIFLSEIMILFELVLVNDFLLHPKMTS